MDKILEMSIDIANLSFTIDKTEEVGMAKIYSKFPYKDKPDAYSVSWSEWIMDSQGDSIQAETEPQTFKVKKIQRFENYEVARLFFVSKVDKISQSYKENGIKK